MDDPESISLYKKMAGLLLTTIVLLSCHGTSSITEHDPQTRGDDLVGNVCCVDQQDAPPEAIVSSSPVKSEDKDDEKKDEGGAFGGTDGTALVGIM